MRSNLLEIRGPGYKSLVPAKADVYVKVGNGYVRKKAKALHEGELIVIHNESIDADLIDIDAILRRRSGRYDQSRRTLHYTNSEGVDVPRLRVDLWEGLGQQEVINFDSETALKENGNDFSKAEYQTGIETTGTLEDRLTVTPTTVHHWLAGEVIAPQDWENYRTLAQINPVFENVYTDKKEGKGFQRAYKIYTGARRVVMKHLTKRKGVKGTNEVKTNGDYSLSFTDEISSVVKELLPSINEDMTALEIESIQHLKGRGNGYEVADSRVKKGVVIGDVESLPIKSLERIATEFHALQIGYNKSIGDIRIKIFKSNLNPYSKKSYFRQVLDSVGPDVSAIVKEMRTPSGRGGKYLSKMQRVLKKSRLGTQAIQEAERINEAIEGYIENGSIDDILGYEYGTFAKLEDTFGRIKKVLPEPFMEFQYRGELNLIAVALSKKGLVNTKEYLIESHSLHKQLESMGLLKYTTLLPAGSNVQKAIGKQVAITDKRVILNILEEYGLEKAKGIVSATMGGIGGRIIAPFAMRFFRRFNSKNG